ncbi:MAG: hypothetical protein MJ240_10190 [Kiritimatiellae bacterium]|nr:hypothetical protein [Kiritimatiellia bacterium]
MKIVALALMIGGAAGAMDFEAFRQPAKESHPETWFHVIGGNASKAGMKDDLAAIKAAGISGIQFFHGQFGTIWPGVKEPIPCLSPAWDDLVAYTADECARLGLGFKMQNCPGWSMSGGPWITPANAMRRLVCGRTDLEASAAGQVTGNLAKASRIRFGRVTTDADADYRDICVLAFPTPEGASEKPHKPVKTAADGPDAMVYSFPEPIVVRTVELPPIGQLDYIHVYEPELHVKVEARMADGSWRKVAEEDYPRSNWMYGWGEAPRFSLAVDEATASEWRVSVRRRASTKFPEARFFSAARPDNWESLAGWTYRALVPRAAPKQNAAAYVRAADVVDVSKAFSPDGGFSWKAPHAGKWTILRFGHVNLGTVNAPAPKEGTGWECSKFDREGAEANFAGYIGRLAAGPLKGKPFKGIVIDSWECGRQSWGRTLEKDFRDLMGYDLRAKLPALFGWVLDDMVATESFLRDWRHVCGRLVEERYYRRMAELAHEQGMEAQFETAYGDVIHGDLLRFWKYADTVMCEFWQPHDETSGDGFVGSYNFKAIRPCVAAAHVYGKKRVAAEAFTNFPLTWNETFQMLKGVADRHFARGVTHCVFHTYTHNPIPGRRLTPGSSFGGQIGTPFLRNQTWWKFMPDFTAYLARCGAMLECGKPVVDVLWVLGDGYDHRPDEKAAFPAGYKYDYVNTDALLTRLTVKNGALAFPDGFAARVLWIPEGTYLAPATAAKVTELEKMGAVVVRGDWRQVGEVLTERKMAPDVRFAAESAPALDDFMWYHRTAGSQEIYFVAAAKKGGFAENVTFRATGKAEIWDPVTGTRSLARVVGRTSSDTTVRVELAESGSAFVVFTAGESAVVASQTPKTIVQPLEGALWRIDFGCNSMTPEAVTTRQLVPWKDMFDDSRKSHSARARAYSGTATYNTTFVWRPTSPVGRVTLDLGTVEAWAEVTLNGKRVGTLWCRPYAVDVTDALQDGINELSIAITSTWHNKLLFQARLPECERDAWTTWRPDPSDEYSPSGLLGPVKLVGQDGK